MCENHEHYHDEDCCCECCEEEKELVRDRRELTDEEIESIIVEKYNTKDEKTKVFIRKALKVHGNWYDYSKVEYKNCKTKVTIVCPIHGDFEQGPEVHLRGSGCNECANKYVSEKFRMTKDEFIKKASEKYNNKFNYDQVDYKGVSTPVKIICPIHGEFFQTPASHLHSSTHGCNKCSREFMRARLAMTAEEFIERSKIVHNNKYTYSKVDYVNNSTPVIIHCPTHGDFEQLPANHLKGCGCPKCAGNVQLTTEEFIEKANKTHNGKYDYSKVNYIDSHTKVTIICPKHGDFDQTPGNHLSGDGCPKCGNEMIGEKLSYTAEEFIEKANKIHKNKYDYSKVNYIDSHTKVTIICPKHGNFDQLPSSHLKGHGCPHCSNFSVGETLTEEYLKLAKIEFRTDGYIIISNDRYIYPDFILPEMNTWIEYNGEQHYFYVDFYHDGRSRTFLEQLERDIEVRKYCKNNNIRLIEIPYFMKTAQEVSDFLDKVLLQNIDPNTLVDYSKLYKLDNTGLNLEDLFPT